MNVTRFASAPAYFPPNHMDMRCLRLQGHNAGPSEDLWLGVSQILPGGHTSHEASLGEKHYIVLDGELTVITDSEEVTLGVWDSCCLGVGEARRLENRTFQMVTVLLAMPYLAVKTSQVQSSPTIVLDGRIPYISENVYVAPTATVIGDVHLGKAASVWFGAVIRGDNAHIKIGACTNIQDNAVLHTDNNAPLSIGDNVSVGHLAMLHGCTIGEGSLVGIGATILNNANIGKYCLIGAKALIGEGKVVPDRSIVQGIPGRVVGEVTDNHLAMMRRASLSYVDRSEMYRCSDVQP